MGGILKSVGNFIWGDQPEPDFSLENMKRPDRIQYKGITDESGRLLPQFKLSSGEGYRDLAQGRLAQELEKAREQATLESRGLAAQQRNDLAQRGGVSGGTAANLSRNLAQQQIDALQKLTRGGLEEAQKIGEKTFDIGREAEKTNLASAIGDVGQRQAFAQNMYGLDMAEYGASKTADAMKRFAPRPKGGVLGGITQGVGSVLGKG